MAINKQAKVLALALGFAGYLMGGPAKAVEPGLSFYPAAGWSVEAFDMGDGQNICSIANEFNNGFIIQFTATSRGMNDMSVDFRQGVFEEGGSYNMSINIPGYLDTADLGVAYNDQVVGFDLVGREGLVEAMDEAGVLDVNVEGNGFRFFLTGFTNAAARFGSCVDGIAPATVAQAAAPEPEGFVYSVDEGMESEEPVLSEEELTAPPMIAQGTVAPEAPVALMGDLVEIPEERYVDVTQQERYLAEELTRTGNDWRDEPELFTDAPEETWEDQPVVSNVVSAVPTVTTVSDPVYPEVQVTTSTAQVEADFSSYEEVALPAAPVYDDRLQSRIDTLQYQVEALKQDKALMQTEIDRLMEEASQDRVAIASDNWNLEAATMKFREAERQVERLGRQLRRERTKHAQEIAKLETMLFDPEVTQSQQLARLADLEGDLDEAHAKLSEQQRKYEARIQILEKQLNQLSY